jgi:hypothetical protein
MVASLKRYELHAVVTQPLEWWCEQAVQMTLDQQVKAEQLLGWVGHVTQQSPDSAWWATILATEWLSRTDARGVPSFWLELCLLPHGVPAEVRRTVLDALGAR